MKVQCEKCKAVYKVDGSKIPPTGDSLKCPKCGNRFPFQRNQSLDKQPDNVNKTCPNCKNIRGPDETECPNCGIIYEKAERVQHRDQEELEKKEAEKRQKEIKEVESKENREEKIKKAKQFFVLSPQKIVFILVTISLMITATFYYQKFQRKKEYISSLNLANSIMALSTIKCVEMCEKYSTVWRDAIDDKYNSDFNDDIMEQRLKFFKYGDINKIDDTKEYVENLLHKLNRPPDLYPDAHKKIITLYGIYSQLHSLAKFPSGTLMSFNKKVNDLQSEYIKIANELKVLLPKEEE